VETPVGRNAGDGSDGVSLSDPVAVRLALEAVFDRQIAIYRELSQLAEELRQAISDGEHQRIVQVVARKQERVEALSNLEAPLLPVKTAWEQLREQVLDSDKASLKRKVEQIGSILKGLLEVEKENEQALQLLARTTQREIHSAQSQRKAHSAYNLPGPPPLPGFLDKKR